MPRADQIFSLTIVGSLLFALVPIANALGQTNISDNNDINVESPMGMHNMHGKRISEEARTEFKNCHDIDADEKECLKNVAEKYDFDSDFMNMKMHHYMKQIGMGNGIMECLREDDRGKASACFLQIYDAHRLEG